ncbi:enolase C-terminal domain-like protein [Kitasatospora sp. NPDC002040]|uniref:enolase C-terminal domain-like protein n=1 Tax=Kitasatospora sp. NPDC002040 TaxID=3154661 RepID=UPI00331B9EBC
MTGVELFRCAVSARTEWLLLRLTDPDGATGWGECSDAGSAALVVKALEGAAGDAFTARTVRGAVAQARADQAARRAGVPLRAWWGGADEPVELYANLNRMPGGRSPAEVAAGAVEAVRAGFRTVKLAPFDAPGDGPLAAVGLARVRAVRAAVGAGIGVLVDCHERLALSELLPLLDEFAELEIGWLEDGVGVERPAELAELRARTELPLAGGEFAYDAGQLDDGLLDFVLPDVKHAGGPEAVLALAKGAGAARVSLHNPAGPVATLHSAHLAAALPAAPLEYAFGEVPWRAELAGERIEDGRLLLPAGPGLGIEPDLGHFAVRALWRGPLCH